MKMTFRWYGKDSDPITLQQIKQIPGMTGIMGLLDYKAAGEVWTDEECKEYIDGVHAAGLECEVIESVNVHEDIKMGVTNTSRTTSPPSATWQSTALRLSCTTSCLYLTGCVPIWHV